MNIRVDIVLWVSVLIGPCSVLASETTRPGTPSDDPQASNICGQLALASAASYAGRPDLFDRVFLLLPPNGEPRTLNDLQRAAFKLGLPTRAVRWTPGRELKIDSPAIVRLDPTSTAGIGHFVVVLRTAAEAVLVLDLPHQPTWIPSKRLWDLWDGIALHVAASESELPLEKRRSPMTLVVPGLTIIAGLSALLLMTINLPRTRSFSSANVPKGGTGAVRHRSQLPLVLSALIAAALVAPSFARWVRELPSPIDRALLEVFPGHQSLIVDARTFDMNPNERTTARYRISNRTRRPAVIGKVTASCGCAVPRMSARQIPAGGSIELLVDVDPVKGETSDFTIDVLFDQPENYHLEMTGSISVRGKVE